MEILILIIFWILWDFDMQILTHKGSTFLIILYFEILKY